MSETGVLGLGRGGIPSALKKGEAREFGRRVAVVDGVRQLVEVPSEMAVIRSVLTLYSRGYSYTAIAHMLNDKKIRTVRGNHWSGTTIRYLIEKESRQRTAIDVKTAQRPVTTTLRHGEGRAYGRRIEVIAGVRQLVTVPAEQKVISRIVQLYARGSTLTEIKCVLNSEAIPGPRGAKWDGRAVKSQIRRACPSLLVTTPEPPTSPEATVTTVPVPGHVNYQMAVTPLLRVRHIALSSTDVHDDVARSRIGKELHDALVETANVCVALANRDPVVVIEQIVAQIRGG